jgi:hypothetical protein
LTFSSLWVIFGLFNSNVLKSGERWPTDCIIITFGNVSNILQFEKFPTKTCLMFGFVIPISIFFSLSIVAYSPSILNIYCISYELGDD